MLARSLAFLAPVPSLLILILLLSPKSVTSIHVPRLRDLAASLHLARGYWSDPRGSVEPPMPGPTALFVDGLGSHAALVNKRRRLRAPLTYPDPGRSATATSPPAFRRDVNTIPNTWYIQRAYQGENFFRWASTLLALHRIPAFTSSHRTWNFATYDDPTQ